uniref:Protein kinase domain-containing protein n=1 Tax=Macrostomum lignano TaxID=282301 RepID=A0A1I8FN80_9PLAT
RAFRELNFLYHVRHENVVSIVSVLEEPNFPFEIYLLCDLMQTDLHRIIVSPQPLSADHVKIFLYQLLRGLKFLHSANILHRDIKPGNLLRAARSLTLEVVTQYYRAPELLMGAQEYSAAIDIWSAGCIFAELLSRSILFQASNPLSQLDLIMDLLGTPDLSDLTSACTAARRYILRLPKRRPKLATTIWSMSQTVTEDALHLLEHMLMFNPKQRSTAASALSHPYLDEARLRYHSCMCTCCPRPASSAYQHQRHACLQHQPHLMQQHHPRACELAITDVHAARLKLADLVMRINQLDPRNRTMPLLLNRQAVNFRGFLKSSVAQTAEMPPSPHRWEQR